MSKKNVKDITTIEEMVAEGQLKRHVFKESHWRLSRPEKPKQWVDYWPGTNTVFNGHGKAIKNGGVEMLLEMLKGNAPKPSGPIQVLFPEGKSWYTYRSIGYFCEKEGFNEGDVRKAIGKGCISDGELKGYTIIKVSWKRKND